MPTKFTLLALPTDYTITGKRVGSPQSTVTVRPLPYRFSNVRVTGDNIAGWRLKIARGQSATTSLDATRQVYRLVGQQLAAYCNPPYVGVTEYLHISGNISSATGGGYPSINSTIDIDADDKARSKLLSHYIASQRKFAGANFVAELRETIEMFKRPLKKVFRESGELAKEMNRFVTSYHKVSWRPDQVGDLRRKLGDMWLGWRFGISPTISDLNDAADAVNDAWDNHSTIPLRGFGRRESSVIDPRLAFSNWSGSPVPVPQMYCEQLTKSTFTVRYKGAVRVHGDTTNVHLDRFGINLLDLPGGVWEGTPWSWLVDYFLNVGEMLDAMRLIFADVSWVNRTVRNAQTINRYNIRSEVPGVSVSAPSRPLYALMTSTSRRALTQMPFPRFHFQIPGLSSLKWLNVASVVQQFEGIDNRIRKFHL